MTLQVWKSRGRYLVACGACSSRGHPAHLPVARTLDPKNEAARNAVLARSRTMRTEFEAALKAVVHRQKIGQLSRQDASARVRKMAEDHAAVLRQMIDETPGAEDGVKATVEKCPWCGDKPPEPVVIEALPDDQHEPASWLNRAGA